MEEKEESLCWRLEMPSFKERVSRDMRCNGDKAL